MRERNTGAKLAWTQALPGSWSGTDFNINRGDYRAFDLDWRHGRWIEKELFQSVTDWFHLDQLIMILAS
jgi:hypothetical protein